jgi:hypothetical protein
MYIWLRFLSWFQRLVRTCGSDCTPATVPRPLHHYQYGPTYKCQQCFLRSMTQLHLPIRVLFRLVGAHKSAGVDLVCTASSPPWSTFFHRMAVCTWLASAIFRDKLPLGLRRLLLLCSYRIFQARNMLTMLPTRCIQSLCSRLAAMAT